MGELHMSLALRFTKTFPEVSSDSLRRQAKSKVLERYTATRTCTEGRQALSFAVPEEKEEEGYSIYFCCWKLDVRPDVYTAGHCLCCGFTR